MNIQFIAQSGFLITLNNGDNIIIDPWLDNPVYPIKLKDLPKIKYVFCSHDHVDHGFKMAMEIAIRDNATLITGYDMAKYAASEGVPKVESCNFGGFFEIGDIKVKLTHAYHSSDIGIPVGFMIQADGITIYHMGDTGYFAETKDYGEMYNIDVLMIPIGGTYTMDPYEANYAIQNLNPKYVIPIHYNTFGKIEQNAEEFKRSVETGSDTKVILLKPGETTKL